MAPRLAILVAMIAGSVPAAGSEYTRSGSLDWYYEEMAVRTPGGTRRVSTWNQAYLLSLFGPLGHELVGEGGESISFEQGHTLSQLAASGNSKNDVLGYSLGWTLLPERLRRYIRVNPALSRTRSTLAWGQPVQLRTLVDSMRSLDLGLSAPLFPTLDVKRSVSGRKDESGAPIVDQSTQEGSEEANYVRGPLYARFRHDRSSTDDRLVAGGKVFSDQTNGEANLSFYALKHGLDNAFLRTTYQGAKSGLASNVRTQRRTAEETGSLTTQRWTVGPWASYLYTSETFSRDLAGGGNERQGTLALSSLRKTSRGHLNNSLHYSRSGGNSDGESLADSLFLDQRVSKALYHVDGGGGWAWARGAGSLFNDSVLQRLTFPVLSGQSVYVEQGTAGSTALSGQTGGTRKNSAGLGADLRYDSALTFSSHYQVARSADLARGTRGVRHSVVNEARLSPYPGMMGTVIHSIAWNEGPAGAAARLEYLTSECDYAAGPLSLSAGYTTNFVASYDASAGADYWIGKTSVQLRGERKGLMGPTPYWIWSVRLRRVL